MKEKRAKAQEMESEMGGSPPVDFSPMPKEEAKSLEKPEAAELKVQEMPNGKPGAQFVDVPVDVLGQVRGKNYVDLKGMSFNAEKGHLSFHLSDSHTMIFKESFQKNFLKVVLKEADEIEQSTKKAPRFEKAEPEKSVARMRILGERDGRTFVGPSGSVKYDGGLRGFTVNLDDKHSVMVDAEMLSRELGIKVSPIAMEKKVGMSR